jgi:hypothetical protein
MSFMTANQADAMLRPFFEDFTKVVNGAWNDWRSNTVAPQMQHKRVRANIVWNQLIANARRQFDGRPDVHVATIKDWDGVLIKDSIFVRMKKGNRNLISRNYPTQTALAFHDQTRDLFGGGICRLELLYILDASDTEIDRIVLVQRHKNSIVWCMDIDDSNLVTADILSIIPPEPDQPGVTVADRILKPKSPKADKKQDGTNNDS